MTKPYEAMVAAALEASEVVLRHYRAGVEAIDKDDGSPVTLADQEAEEAIIAHLAQEAPDIPVIGEESVAAGRIPGIGARFFLVDPLDGTKEFIRGTGEFTVNIALIDEGIPLAGAVTVPAKGLVYFGAQDTGAWRASCFFKDGIIPDERTTLAVRDVPAEGSIAMASRSHGSPATRAFLEELGVGTTMPAGSSLKFCAIAEGEADFYPRLGRTMEWDTAAAHAVLKAAGGEVYALGDDNQRLGPLKYGKTERGFDNPHFLAVGRER
jgi:3'(2'),5'-bisphosphate nucleotidase